MTKKLNKGLKSLLVFVLSLSIFCIYDVYAADKEMTGNCEQDFSGNQSEIDTCKTCKSKLANKFSWEDIEQNDNYIKAKITGDNDKTFHLTIKYTGGYSTTMDVNTNREFTIPSRFNGDDYVKVSISGVLNSEATIKNGNNTFSCNGKFVVESNYTYESNKEDGYANASKNGICARYKNGTLNNNDKKVIDDDTKFNRLNKGGELSYDKIKNVPDLVKQFNNLFPYCSMDTVKDIYSDKMVLSQIYNAMSIIINKSSFTSTILPDSENNGFKKIDNINEIEKGINLVCDAFAKSNERKFYYESSESKYMIFHTTPNNNSETKVCSSVCREEITITYGPPVAVKAGMCFEYEVEVKSKVTCNAKIENDMPKMSDYVSCTPTAHCNNHGGYYFDQGGPSEEFDSCINSIDGGKYTQKAIDKCYTKVYGKKNKKSKVSNTSLYNSSVEKLANSSNPNWCNNPGSIRTESSAAQVYNSYRNGYQGGYYYRKDGKINWQKYDSTYSNEDKRKLADGSVIPIYPGCYWNGYGRYYFGSYTKGVRTVLNDSHIRINYADGGDRLAYWQYIPVNGFKKSSVCNEYCIWKAPTNCYLNVLAPNSGNGKGNSAYNAYYNDMDNYNKAIEGCKADAKCNESTAKYIMTVNKADGDITACKESGSGLVDGNKCTTWNEENGNNKGLTRKDKDHTIVKEVNGVCTDDNDKSGYKYRALISFPGSYVNNKNGVVKFNVPDEDKAFYSYKNGQYCVPLNAKNVNKDWWIWDQVYMRNDNYISKVKYKDKKDISGTTYNKYDGTYNIGATIQNFGQFGWKFDLSCFYAVYNDGVDTDVNPTCKGKDCDKTTIYNYDTKAAALDDLFPKEDNSDGNVVPNGSTIEVKEKTKVNKLNYTSSKSNVKKVTNSTGRDVGYNWSCDATNLLVENYPITPTALIKKIQSKGDSIYNDSSERDFSITLTKNNIKNIREYNKNHKFTDYGTDMYLNDNTVRYKQSDKYKNVIFYKSSLLNDEKYVSKVKKPNNHLCNNMRNGKCDTYDYKNIDDGCVKLRQ